MSRPFTVAGVREAYLSFFAAKGCVRYPSAALVPENDPTTLLARSRLSVQPVEARHFALIEAMGG